MASILENNLAQLVADAFVSADLFLNATLTREVPGVAADPADPPAPTTTAYPCKAIEDTWSKGLLAGGLVRGTDVRILILAKTLAVEPKPEDRITIRGATYRVVPAGIGGLAAVQTDPARATWELRCEN
jgi:hypothetical protein